MNLFFTSWFCPAAQLQLTLKTSDLLQLMLQGALA
jgi:hypothetical protein